MLNLLKYTLNNSNSNSNSDTIFINEYIVTKLTCEVKFIFNYILLSWLYLYSM